MRLHRPSPAMVVAVIALVISLGGNALAAVLITNTNQVANGALTGADLQNSTVRGIDVGNGSLRLADLSPAEVATLLRTTSAAGGDLTGTLAALQLGSNTVGFDEMLNDSVGHNELRSLSVGASEMTTDAVGHTALANDAVGFDEMLNDSVGHNELRSLSVGRSEIVPNEVGSSELDISLQSLHVVDAAGSVNNGECSSPFNDAASSVFVGSLVIVFGNRSADTGWVVEGDTTTDFGFGRLRVCNFTGAAADPPPLTVSYLTIAP